MDYLFKTIRKYGEQQWCSSLAVDLRQVHFRDWVSPASKLQYDRIIVKAPSRERVKSFE